MGIAVSPRHVVFEPIPSSDLSLEDKIDLFVARVDGWHLEVADRVINGWEVEKAPCIVAPHGGPINYLMYDETGQVVRASRIRPVQVMNQIPDSGWAVLQIVINYFEIAGLFKFFERSCADDTYKLLQRGFFDVFPELIEHGEKPAKIVFSLRNGLYHKGVRGSDVFISGNLPEPVSYDSAHEVLKINPHTFVRRLRNHLKEYGERLLDNRETGLRAKFDAAFYYYYIS